MINHNEKEYFKKNVYTCITDPLLCSKNEHNIINQLYLNFKILKYLKRKKGIAASWWLLKLSDK